MKDDDDANDVSWEEKSQKWYSKNPMFHVTQIEKRANFGLLEFFAGSSKPFNFNLRFLLKSVIFAF